MSQLVNMQTDPGKPSNTAIAVPENKQPEVSTKPEYPYGLQITLNNESIKKLGLDVAQFRVGDSIRIEANAEVKGVSISENDYGDAGVEQRLEIQITDIGLSPGSGEFEDSFNQAVNDAKVYRGISPGEVPTGGGFKKGLWDATR